MNWDLLLYVVFPRLFYSSSFHNVPVSSFCLRKADSLFGICVICHLNDSEAENLALLLCLLHPTPVLSYGTFSCK